MTTPRPTRVEIQASEVRIKAETLEPDIRASVGGRVEVAAEVQNQVDVQIQVVEII